MIAQWYDLNIFVHHFIQMWELQHREIQIVSTFHCRNPCTMITKVDIFCCIRELLKGLNCHPYVMACCFPRSTKLKPELKHHCFIWLNSFIFINMTKVSNDNLLMAGLMIWFWGIFMQEDLSRFVFKILWMFWLLQHLLKWQLAFVSINENWNI